MTPQELHTAVDERRRELGLVWWQVAVAVDTSLNQLSRLKAGACSPAVRRLVEAWLEKTGRKQADPRKE